MDAHDDYARRETFEDVRVQLTAWLEGEGDDSEIDPRIWSALLDDVELMRAARKGGLARLAQRYCTDLKHFGRPSRPHREEAEVGPDARSEALAEIAACATDRYEWAVRGFRSTHLAGGLVALDQLTAWVEEQAKREGPPAESYVRVPLPQVALERVMLARSAGEYAAALAAEAERLASVEDAELPGGFHEAPEVLEYGPPGESKKRVAIRGDGVLAQLKHLVSGPIGGLRSHISWSEAEAVAFVLCGWIPSLPKARVSVRFSHGLYPALSRLRLEVDPRLTPKEVGHLYNTWRARFHVGRDRPMDEKHLALAIFAERTRTEGRPWSELRAQWNEGHPGWAFATDEDPFAKRFGLECRTAWSRVTGEKWGQPMGAPVRPFAQKPREEEPR